jgi:hypothetical protein
MVSYKKIGILTRLFALCCAAGLAVSMLSACSDSASSGGERSSGVEYNGATNDAPLSKSGGNQDFDDDLDITDTFVDEYFRNYILSYVLHKIDSWSTEAEIREARIYYKDVKTVTSLLINANPYAKEPTITNLTGIEYFTYLQDFTCQDIHFDLESIDLSGLMFLKSVKIQSITDLTFFAVSGCVALEEIYYYGNSGILDHDKAALDASNCISLKSLNCYDNSLTELNISGCVSLEELNCGSNKLASLDVSQSPNLSVLKCSDNKLSVLDVSQNAALRSLECSNNLLEHLDVSKNAMLQKLYCSKNSLSELDVSNCILLTDLRYSSKLKDKVIGIPPACDVKDSYL